MTSPNQLDFGHLPHDLCTLYCAQEGLGWKQLYYGHLTPLWIHMMNFYHPQVNGLQYFTKEISLKWQAVFQIWKIQNTHSHLENPEQEECSQLQAAVNQVFFEAKSGPLLQALIDHITPAQIMNCPT